MKINELPGVTLDTDFVDYYDEHLPSSWRSEIFPRFSGNQWRRSDIFAKLREMRLPTPLHGLVSGFPLKYDLVVVYLDEKGHHGKGKQLMPLNVARTEHPSALASLYVGDIERWQWPGPISMREVRIGRRRWLLRYKSDHPWASNCGNVEIEFIRELPSMNDMPIPFPIYALDFVEKGVDHYSYYGRRTPQIHYFDITFSPKLQGTPLEQKLRPKDAAALIQESLCRISQL